MVAAHRDNLGVGAGANDNASGTAALIELARSYAQAPIPSSSAPAPVRPTHTLVFLSTDGGAFGGIGADQFAAASPYRHGAFALIDLDAIAGRGPPRLQIAANTARSPADSLVQTASARITEQAGVPPARPPAWQQLVTLAFPYSLYEQGPVLARGIPALTLTTAGDLPPAALGDTPHHLNGARLAVIGRSTQQLLGSLDQGLDLAQGTTSYVYLGQRIVRGWAIELVLVAMLLPFLVATVDLFAHCRRRRIALAPALRSLRSRIGFWLFLAAMFALLVVVGAFPRGVPLPVAPETAAARHWPVLPLAVLGVFAFVAWLVVRVRLRAAPPGTARGGARRSHRRAARPRRRRAADRRDQPVHAPLPAAVAPRVALAPAGARVEASGASRRARGRPRRACARARLVRAPLRARPGRALVPDRARRRRLRLAGDGADRARLARGRLAAGRARRRALRPVSERAERPPRGPIRETIRRVVLSHAPPPRRAAPSRRRLRRRGAGSGRRRPRPARRRPAG